MAREAMVTRTIVGTKALCMVVDINAGETMTKQYTIGSTFKDEQKLFKALEKVVNTEDGIKLVHILESETVEKLLGMPEADFIAHAVELDPETRKRLS